MNTLFDSIHTIAIVGLSDNPQRPSYDVASYLQLQGFRIIPVNPKAKEILHEVSYPDLLSIPQSITIDVVDIFRASAYVLPHVQEAIKRGDANIIWMQEGVVNEEAKKLAEAHGMTVIMNACMMKTHRRST